VWHKIRSALRNMLSPRTGNSETPCTDLFWLVFWMMAAVFLLIVILAIGFAVVGALRG